MIFALGGLIAAGVGMVFGLPSACGSRASTCSVSTLAAQFFVEWVFTKVGWFCNDNASGVITAPRLVVAGSDFGTPVGATC